MLICVACLCAGQFIWKRFDGVGSLCYVWAILIAHFLLHENIGRVKVLGLCLVVVGVVGVSVG